MPETIKMLIVLTVIAGASGLGLSAMNDATVPLIAENERLFTLKSINAVIPDAQKPDACTKYEPAFDNSPDQDAVCVDGYKVYRGRQGSEVVGIAVEAVGDEAYAGTILCLVGLKLDGMLTGIQVLRHSETPGLGSLFTKCAFQQQMVGYGPDDIKWQASKDGGDIDQLSGATISTRSMLDAIHKAQNLLKEKKDQILLGTALKEGEVCDAR